MPDFMFTKALDGLANGNLAPFFSYLILIGTVMFSICLHEFSHAYVAFRLGDDTAAQEGHLSMNPMIQMGPISLIILFVIGFAWGAVPVNPRNFEHRRDMMLVALAGPLANLFLCILAGIVLTFIAVPLGNGTIPKEVFTFFYTLGVMNALLFIFNLIPLPVLDGYKILSYFVPHCENIDSGMAGNITLMGMMVMFMTPPLMKGLWDAADGLLNVFYFSPAF